MARILVGTHTSVLLAFATAGTISAATAQDVPRGDRVYTIADSLPGSVGGVTVDRTGTVYVADFGETVWKVTPDGRARVFATGLYGASGNAIDSRGILFQANFYGNYISRIDRHGGQETFAAEGLNGPVGIAIDPDDNLYVVNCRGNSITKLSAAGEVSPFAESELLNCPNGITRGPQGNLFVVNFSDERMLKVSPDGSVDEFATLPGGGNGHITYTRGSLFATSFQGHRVYRVSLSGDVKLLGGTGAPGEQDGPALEARFTFPNGIAASPTGTRLYVNDWINRAPPTVEVPQQPIWVLRQIRLASLSDELLTALSAGGVSAMVDAYRAWKSDPSTASIFTEVEANGLGYQLMGRGQLEAATEVFKLNVESYPRSFNVYDSLGEAYMNAGETELAIQNYERSLELNPANANAVEMLAKLRGE